MFDWLKRLFRKRETEEPNIIRAAPAGPEPPTPQPKQTLRPPISRPVSKDMEVMRIRQANRNRRNDYRYSEHFKKRQPTTARKLWRPNATFNEEEESRIRRRHR
jgi:hypothetical protein